MNSRNSTARADAHVDEAREYIAVYGSLMRGEGMLDKLGAEPHLDFIGPAAIPGRLYDLGDFPGLRSGDGEVPGELFAVTHAKVLPILDAYEGCQPDEPQASLFVRARMQLIEPPVEAWVYLFNGSIDGCPQVAGMSWSEYKARRQS